MIETNSPLSMEEAVLSVRAIIAGQNRKCFVGTLGCQQNEADSEKIRGIAVQMGYLITDIPDEASLLILNTCAIREHAEMRALSLLGTFQSVKAKNPEAVVGICGCMAAEPKAVAKFKTDFHYVNFTLEPNRLFRLPFLVGNALAHGRRTFLFGEDDGSVEEGLPSVRTARHRANVTVMYGCNNFCSYCIVPYVRGRERSRESTLILTECRDLVADGVKEIMLLGQNVNSYRSDIGFAALLRKIAEIDGDFILRFMTSHPKDVSEELIQTMHDFPTKIAPYFHLPLQSGSNSVLKAMNRCYSVEKYTEIVKKLRNAVPNIVLSTDIIVGFPGETEEDFEATMKVVREVRYDLIYSFIYSPREGTRAAKMDSSISEAEKNARLTRLIAEEKEIMLEKNLPYEGRIIRVLVDETDRDEPNRYLGRTPGGKLVRLYSEKNPIGNFVSAKITKATPFDLFGEAVYNEK